jgi:hypothetical protein
MVRIRNIQVIDRALNCTYDIFSIGEDDFKEIFPGQFQDIEFVKDFVTRVGDERATRILSRLWKTRVDKKKVRGIHGTLFFELDFKKKYYPTKSEHDMVTGFENNLKTTNKT